MWKRIIPVLVGLGLLGLLVYQLVGLGSSECMVCMSFGGRRHCATARAPSQELAITEAQTSACSRIARGMSNSTACANQEPEKTTCK